MIKREIQEQGMFQLKIQKIKRKKEKVQKKERWITLHKTSKVQTRKQAKEGKIERNNRCRALQDSDNEEENKTVKREEETIDEEQVVKLYKKVEHKRKSKQKEDA